MILVPGKTDRQMHDKSYLLPLEAMVECYGSRKAKVRPQTWISLGFSDGETERDWTALEFLDKQQWVFSAGLCHELALV